MDVGDWKTKVEEGALRDAQFTGPDRTVLTQRLRKKLI